MARTALRSFIRSLFSQHSQHASRNSSTAATSTCSSGAQGASTSGASQTAAGLGTQSETLPNVVVFSPNHLHVHYYGTHPGMLQTVAWRQAYKPGSQTPAWIPFLAGGGLTALGFAAYQAYSDGNIVRPAGLMTTSFVPHLWPFKWRSASAQAPGQELMVPHVMTESLPLPCLPPNLPVPASIPEHDASPNTPLTRASITEASARASPAVVHLVVTEGDDVPTLLDHRSSGSGFIYDPSGFILTNAHVVRGAANGKRSLTVTTQDGRVFKGRVLNVDKTSDLAVVKVDSPDALPTACIGHSSRLRVGEWVVALGSPLMLKHSVTAGIISCAERKGTELGISSARTGYIQTDAAVNQGNSGGPLINLDGEVVGVNAMKAVAADGVSFAIPIDAVKDIVRQFSTMGRVVRPFVGITMLEISNGGLKQLKEKMPGLPPMQSAIVVHKVVDGSPAQEAGLQPDDIITSVQGQTSMSMSQLVDVFTKHIGKPVELRVLRRSGSGAEYTVLPKTITPAEAADQ